MKYYIDLKDRIKEHEGYRNTVYKDSLGFATIGYGHLVTPEDPYKEGIEYSKEELDAQFEADFQTAVNNAEILILHHNEITNIVDDAKCVLIEMVFQLGIGGVSKFKKMWEALKKQDYGEASFQMMDSRWAKQTPARARSLAEIMRSCKS
jgi:lysozyme